jgi:hypothetical protein
MKSFEEMQKNWKQGKGAAYNAVPLSEAMLTKLIRSGVKKEQKMVWEYCVASGFWQWLVYASLTHFIVRFWGDWQFVIACPAVIILYIPFTVMFIKKFKHMRILKFEKSYLQSQDIHYSLKTQYEMLKDFFVFKKRFDWVNIPFCCFLIAMILYKYGLIPSIQENIIAWLIVFVIYIILFVTATYVENKKRFKIPLEKMKSVISEMEM